jgi:hypothetical protein
MKNTPNLKPMFFHGKTIDGYRYTISGIIEKNILSMGIAVCGHGDHFCRSKGRLISSGRLLNQRSLSHGRFYIKLESLPEKRDFTMFTDHISMYNNFYKKDLLQEFGLK